MTIFELTFLGLTRAMTFNGILLVLQKILQEEQIGPKCSYLFAKLNTEAATGGDL